MSARSSSKGSTLARQHPDRLEIVPRSARATGSSMARASGLVGRASREFFCAARRLTATVERCSSWAFRWAGSTSAVLSRDPG
jgi:hypothetical protein